MINKCDRVARLKRLEQLMDRQFKVLGIDIGLDGLIGLVPVVGDVLTSFVGLYIIFEAHRLGARRWTVVRMVLNWGIDLGIGSVPVVGDIFDFAWKSNTMNVRLLIVDLERRAEHLREVNREAIRAAAA
jgi:hypothetical protein